LYFRQSTMLKIFHHLLSFPIGLLDRLQFLPFYDISKIVSS